MNNILERVNKVMSIGEECITDREMEGLFTEKERPLIYDGFEPSGRLHLAQGLLKAHNVNTLIDCGCDVILWIADIFAQLNQKFGGDMKKIRTAGEYMIHTWKACGMKVDGVQFVWASEEIQRRQGEYWPLVMDISRRFNMARILRCTQALGRKESDTLTLAQILYPAMQCADIFFLHADVCQLGMDQRKINMLSREYAGLKDCHKLAASRPAPIILSHHMLLGLREGQEKSSKSDIDSCIFIDDGPGDVNRKINGAFCPPQKVASNPCIDWIKHILFPILLSKKQTIIIDRRDQDSLPFTNYIELEQAYLSGLIHPSDLKTWMKKIINELMDPVRERLNEPELKKMGAKIKAWQQKEAAEKEKRGGERSQLDLLAEKWSISPSVVRALIDSEDGDMEKVDRMLHALSEVK